MTLDVGNAYVDIRKIAAEIPVGTTDNSHTCPFCRGGNNGDRGFSITRTGEAEVKFCCHRASCHRAGTVAAWGHRLERPRLSVVGTSAVSMDETVFTPRMYLGDTGQLDQEWLSALRDLFGFGQIDIDFGNWRMDLTSRHLIVPIFSPNGVQRGVETRIPPWLRNQRPYIGQPKTSSYRELNETWVGWFRRTKTGPIVLVEDTVSALKVSRHFQTCCLLGTHLPIEKVKEINEVAGNNGVVIALDKDATDKAIKYVKEWGFILSNFRHVQLSKDMKFMSDTEIKETINCG